MENLCFRPDCFVRVRPIVDRQLAGGYIKNNIETNNNQLNTKIHAEHSHFFFSVNVAEFEFSYGYFLQLQCTQKLLSSREQEQQLDGIRSRLAQFE